jgi:predicted NBD/HSP70 family sugar kinase
LGWGSAFFLFRCTGIINEQESVTKRAPMTPAKATHEQIRRHNRQLLLRAVYSGSENNRAALAQATGLAKPTVSDLIAELIAEGLLVEGGHGESTESGGKRPRLLEFVPGARQVIGVSLDSRSALGLLSNLSGQIVAEHVADFDSHQTNSDLVECLKEVINGLVAQLDAPLLCIGIGVPGLVNKDTGTIITSANLGWHNIPLGEMLSEVYDVPVYVGNNTEQAAMAQVARLGAALEVAPGANFGASEPSHSLVTVLMNDYVEVGFALEGSVYRSGGDIGCLRVAGDQRLDELLGWPAVQRRLEVLCQQYPHSRLLEQREPSYLQIRSAADHDDPAALALYDELVSHVAQVFAWIIGLLRPDHLSLVGPVADLGERLVEKISSAVSDLLLPELAQAVTFSLADDARNLSATGAVVQSLRSELGIL